jgi:hypothetical protein
MEANMRTRTTLTVKELRTILRFTRDVIGAVHKVLGTLDPKMKVWIPPGMSPLTCRIHPMSSCVLPGIKKSAR